MPRQKGINFKGTGRWDRGSRRTDWGKPGRWGDGLTMGDVLGGGEKKPSRRRRSTSVLGLLLERWMPPEEYEPPDPNREVEEKSSMFKRLIDWIRSKGVKNG